MMAGALWIDAASQQVIRLESWFPEDDDQTVQGSSIRIERTLVHNEVWLPSHVEGNVRLGFAFGTFSTFPTTIRYADHKRFSVGTESTVALPDPQR